MESSGITDRKHWEEPSLISLVPQTKVNKPESTHEKISDPSWVILYKTNQTKPPQTVSFQT